MKVTSLALVAVFLLAAPVADAYAIRSSVGAVDAQTGDVHTLSTTVTNPTNQSTGRIVVAMNIVDLKKDRVVDPEDWSPLRTQYLSTLAPGESIELNWTLITFLSGDYALYFVAIEEPAGPTAAGGTDATQAVHVIVHEKPRYNPEGILYAVILVPAIMGGFWGGIALWRRRRLD